MSDDGFAPLECTDCQKFMKQLRESRTEEEGAKAFDRLLCCTSNGHISLVNRALKLAELVTRDLRWRLGDGALDDEELAIDVLEEFKGVVEREQVENPGALVRRIMTRRIVDRMRKKHRPELWSREFTPVFDRPVHDDAPTSDRAEPYERELRRTIAGFPKGERDVLERKLRGMTTMAIGKELKISESAVRQRLSRAMKRLSKTYGKPLHFHEPPEEPQPPTAGEP